ncbi:MAG TPA: insulinase family protein, partial [Acidimicrobiia bacterium]|nr:insulinase family protein [Acidimicrobiia bacterium]
GALMNRLGRNEITLGEVPTVDEMIRRIDAVTRDDATRVIEQVFGGPRTLAAVGPFDADTFAPVSAA